MSKERFGDDIKLILNPQHDFSCDPYEQPELVNPVQANNKLAVLSNRLIEVTQGITRSNRRIGALMRQRRELQNAVEIVERQILRTRPPTATQVKTLKMQDAYITTQAELLGLGDAYALAKKSVAELDDQILEIEYRLKSAHAWTSAMKLHGDHIKTHLSYVKADRANQ